MYKHYYPKPNGGNPQSDNVASVYRFHDSVAMHLPGGETVYMTQRAASILAARLRDYSRSVRTEKFGDSPLGTAHIRLDSGDLQ